MNERPFISVVIPVRNEEAFLAATLKELQDQDYPTHRCEFLVADGRSDDRTREIVEEIGQADPRVRLIDNPGRRSSAGRNAGFRAARGDIMVVVDGHVLIGRRDYLTKLAEHAEASGADCLGRPQPLIAREPGGVAEAIVACRATRIGHSLESFIHSKHEGWAPAASMGAAYRRHVFERIGYVDESFDACEDLEFNTRVDEAGLRCWTSPDLTVRYFARESLPALFRQMRRYGFGRFKYLRKHPSQISVGQVLPPLMALGVVSLPLIGLVSIPLMLIGIALAMAYGAIVWSAASGLARSTPGIPATTHARVFLAIHFGVGLGFLHGMLRGGRLPGHRDVADRTENQDGVSNA